MKIKAVFGRFVLIAVLVFFVGQITLVAAGMGQTHLVNSQVEVSEPYAGTADFQWAEEVEFGDYVYTGTRGADIEIIIEVTGGPVTQMAIESDGEWVKNVTARDADGDGEVVLTLNTTLGITHPDSVQVADDELITVSESGVVPGDDAESGDYSLLATTETDDQSYGTLSLDEPVEQDAIDGTYTYVDVSTQYITPGQGEYLFGEEYLYHSNGSNLLALGYTTANVAWSREYSHTVDDDESNYHTMVHNGHVIRYSTTEPTLSIFDASSGELVHERDFTNNNTISTFFADADASGDWIYISSNPDGVRYGINLESGNEFVERENIRQFTVAFEEIPDYTCESTGCSEPITGVTITRNSPTLEDLWTMEYTADEGQVRDGYETETYTDLPSTLVTDDTIYVEEEGDVISIDNSTGTVEWETEFLADININTETSLVRADSRVFLSIEYHDEESELLEVHEDGDMESVSQSLSEIRNTSDRAYVHPSVGNIEFYNPVAYGDVRNSGIVARNVTSDETYQTPLRGDLVEAGGNIFIGGDLVESGDILVGESDGVRIITSASIEQTDLGAQTGGETETATDTSPPTPSETSTLTSTENAEQGSRQPTEATTTDAEPVATGGGGSGFTVITAVVAGLLAIFALRRADE